MSQNEKIADYLKSGKSINPMIALHKFHCFRLAARISDLREDGYNISTEMTKGKKSYAIYRLEVEDGHI